MWTYCDPKILNKLPDLKTFLWVQNVFVSPLMDFLECKWNGCFPISHHEIFLSSAFLFASAHGNCPGTCRRILRKSIITAAKKLPTSVLYGSQVLYFNPMIFRLEHLSVVENTVKHIHFQDYRHEIIALQQCIMYNSLIYFFLADLNSLNTTFVERTYYWFLLIKIYGKKLVQSQHNNGETKSIHLKIALM